MIALAEVVAHAPYYRTGWYDSEKTILVMDVVGRWTWLQGLEAVRQFNQIIETVPHSVYSVFHFNSTETIMPQGTNALQAIRQILAMNPPNEKLTILARQGYTLSLFIEIGLKATKLITLPSKIRFVDSFDQALKLIEREKRKGTQFAQ